jgi:hypothetical protein
MLQALLYACTKSQENTPSEISPPVISAALTPDTPVSIAAAKVNAIILILFFIACPPHADIEKNLFPFPACFSYIYFISINSKKKEPQISPRLHLLPYIQ